MKILFVDDSPLICLRYKRMLLENGYEVTTANSMSEAMLVARQEPPDLAIIDFYMPDGNGDELCRTMLADPVTKHVLVAMHSTRMDVVEQSLSAGAIDLIHKGSSDRLFLLRVASMNRFMEARAKQFELIRKAKEAAEAASLEQQRQKKYLQKIIDALPHPFYVVDAASYRIMLANVAVAPHSVVGKMCYSVIYGINAPCEGSDRPCPPS